MPRQDHEHSVGFRPDGFISQGKNLHLVPFPSFRTAVTKSACWAPALRLHPGPRHRPPGFLPPDTRQAPSAFRSRLAGSPLSPVGQAGPPHTAPLGQSSPAASEESPRTGGRGHFPLDTGRPPEPPPSRLPRLGGRRWAGAFSALLSPRSLGVCRPPSSTPTGEYACRLPRLPPPSPVPEVRGRPQRAHKSGNPAVFLPLGCANTRSGSLSWRRPLPARFCRTRRASPSGSALLLPGPARTVPSFGRAP